MSGDSRLGVRLPWLWPANFAPPGDDRRVPVIRIRRLKTGAAAMASALVLGLVACGADTPAPTGGMTSRHPDRDDAPAATDLSAAPVLLNEVLFLPANGQPTFVELKATGKRATLTGMVLVNDQGESFAIPEATPALDVDQPLLILFDGTNRVEGSTVHADRTEFLGPGSGFLELRSADNTLLDRVAWGSDQAGAVRLGRGGIIHELEPGLTIGRFPLSTLVDSLEWTVFYPAQATPGTANPQPAVAVMLPLNGAVIKDVNSELSWYPVPGAAEYRVQVAQQDTFSASLVDETTSERALRVELQPGSYFWRVQAIAENGALAEWSPAQSLTVDPHFSAAHVAGPAQHQTALTVPFIAQHKDTAMLLLESQNETGAHAWDVPHPELDDGDPADNMNCVLASIAMINAFYGGDLSQDRIGYEILKEVASVLLPGPEWDLNYGRGFYTAETTKALAFALEGESVFHPRPQTPDVLWADIQLGIDAGAPILAADPNHAFVITGYYEFLSTRYVMINDPWHGPYAVELAGITWDTYWMTSPDSIPVLNDPEIGMDSDGDGIVDFDETQRFGTGPNDPDTDKDDLEDKDDVRASIYDEEWGYSLAPLLFPERDYDEDGVKMELDEDSDGGGCFDGMEDFDRDGKYEAPETWNFDEKDDACFWGIQEMVQDTTMVYEDGSTHHNRQHFLATFSLRAVGDGELEGVGRVSYALTAEQNEVGSPPCDGLHTLVGGEAQSWQVELNGEFQKLQDGSTLVSAQATPEHGPPFTTQFVGSCPSEPEQNEGWPWSGVGGILKDGVYEQYTDLPCFFGDTGECWQRITLQQGAGME